MDNIPFKLMEDQNRENRPCSLGDLFAVKTVKNKFLFVPCLFDPSAPDDPMWVGGTWAGNMSGCKLAPDWN